MNRSPSKIRSQGTSMLPLITPGALVRIDFTARKYSVGDIVVFYHHQQLLIHRIIAKPARNTMLLKGDNNGTIDGIFQTSQILGKVTSITNSGRLIDLSISPHKELKYLLLLLSLIKLVTAKMFKKTNTGNAYGVKRNFC